jgi:tRNA-modifying protein YgfZ
MLLPDWKKLSTEHFGNPLLEQRKLLEQKAFVQRSDQTVLEIQGPDSLSWLHSLTSQNILNLKPGDSTESLLLTPNGHVEQQLKLIVTDTGAFVIVHKDKAAALVEWLNKMRFRSKVEVIVRNELNCYGAFAELSDLGPTWKDPWSIPSASSVSYNPNRKQFFWQELISQSPPALERAGLMAYHALRIAAGRPEITDVDERTLPHEFDWLNSAVHLSKGCYRGQETVSKVHNLGHPPRRLAILNLEQGDMIAASGDEVSYQEKVVGKVIAAGLHFEEGSIALAILNRNTPYLDLIVRSGESQIAATQEMLVPHDAGKAANLPRPSAFKLSSKK